MVSTTASMLLAMLMMGTPDAAPASPLPRVTLSTERGDIVLVLQIQQAPATSCNFLRYVASGAYDGGTFFRTVVVGTNDNPNPIDVVQAATPAGSDDTGLGPIPLERTRDTGLRHLAGAISMARNGPDTATSSFFIVVSYAPALDYGGARNPDGQGFAAFGSVAEGMEVVHAIHALPATDEQIDPPVRIVSARLEGAMPAACRT